MGAARPWPIVEELVPLYYAALYRYAYRLTGSRSDAEDLTQETFCSAKAKAGQLRDEEKVKSWLFSILRNAFLFRVRRQKQAGFVSLETLETLTPLATQENFPQFDVEQLQNVLHTLPEEYRTPLILYYFEELSYRDIAEQMQIPMGTVMSRLARAKAYLRRSLLTEP